MKMSHNVNYVKDGNASYDVHLPLVMEYIRKLDGVNISDIRTTFCVDWRTAKRYVNLLRDLGLIYLKDNRNWYPVAIYETTETIEVIEYVA